MKSSSCSRALGKEQQSLLLSEADLAIDFSHHQAVLHHIDLCCHYKKNIVIGTTGWDNHLLDAKKESHRRTNRVPLLS